MKVTFIGHASILIETRGLSILSDPWWDHPCFGAQWWNYPRAVGHIPEQMKLDYIYISHGHHDHLHPGTLSKLDRSAKVLIAAGTDLAEGIRKLGFEVIEVGPDEERSLGNGVACRIMPTCNDDSLMVVSDGSEVCMNLNDAMHASPRDVQVRFVNRLRQLYPTIDYVFCGYGVASHFPNCYRIPGKDREATAAARQRHFNAQWAGIVQGLAPRFAFPFAADVVFLEEDLFWVNEPTHNAERPLAALARLQPAFQGQVFDIAPGFVVENGRITEPRARQPVRAESLRQEMAEEIAKANRFGLADKDTVEAIQRLLAENLQKCRAFLQGYAGDYRALIRFPQSSHGILVEKRGSNLELKRVEGTVDGAWDVAFTARAQYLRTSLTRKYGNETVFVGSGGMFDYPSRTQAERNLQRELSVLIRQHSEPMKPRPPARGALIGGLKRLAARALGRGERDLYDLGTWTVWRRE
jgi:hypothetical protein